MIVLIFPNFIRKVVASIGLLCHMNGQMIACTTDKICNVVINTTYSMILTVKCSLQITIK